MSHNYLRRYRKRDTFTQAELADLLGVNCRLKVIRFERQQFLPKLDTALAYQIIFDVPVHEMFPALHKDIKKEVLKRSKRLTQQYISAPCTPQVKRRMQVLNDIMRRL